MDIVLGEEVVGLKVRMYSGFPYKGVLTKSTPWEEAPVLEIKEIGYIATLSNGNRTATWVLDADVVGTYAHGDRALIKQGEYPVAIGTVVKRG